MHYHTYRDVTLSEIGIGCYGLSGAYGRVDVDETKRVLARAHELGVNFFDTAEAYGNAEQILGEVIKPFRNEVFLATKVGMREGMQPSLSAGYIRSACEDSLHRLGVEHIDLYQVHFDDPHTPIQETIAALEALVGAGKIRHYGVGHLPMERVKEYISNGSVFSVLMEFSAAARQARQALLPLCREHEVGAIAFSITGRGLLSGKYPAGHAFDPGDIRSIDPLFQRERLESGLRLARRLGEVGARYGKTAVQVAIAWVLGQPGIICALTGPSTLPHLRENLEASGWRLPEPDLAELEVLIEQEDAWLAGEQAASLLRILSQSLPSNAAQAFTELVYVIETAAQLNLISEEQAMSIFQELYPLRCRLDDDVATELEELRLDLRDVLEVDDEPTP